MGIFDKIQKVLKSDENKNKTTNQNKKDKNLMNKSVKETNENNNLNNEDNKNNTINNSIFPKNSEEFPFEPYDGEEPYIFASFSHDDDTLIYPELKRVYDEGYNIWYDKGITPIKPKIIQEKIKNSSFFIVFITPNSIESQNVRIEINYATSINKPCISIHLMKTKLKYGLETSLFLEKSIQKYDLDNKLYIEKINKIFNLNGLKTKYKPNEISENYNFKYLEELIHSGQKEIQLEHDIILEKLEEKEYLKGILVDVDNLIIEGNQHIIDAKGKTRIFKTTGKNIKIKNITLKNGYANNGGAIYNRENLTLINTILKNNNARGKLDEEISYKSIETGGAIFNIGTLIIVNSILTENIAEKKGGAIHNERGKITINNTIINKNKAKEGGAISNDRKLTIQNSTLENNTAEKGGGIHNDDKIKIEKTIINKNKANVGAVICNEQNGKITLLDTTIHENIATYDGVIKNDRLLIMRNTKIERNKTEKGNLITNNGYMKILESEIISNVNKNCVIINYAYKTYQMYLEGTIIENNHSKNIIDNKSKLIINLCKIRNNKTAESAILNEGKKCNILKTTFENNKSTIINNRTNLIIKNPKIKDDTYKSILNKGIITILPKIIRKIIENEGTIKYLTFKEENNFTKLNNLIQKGNNEIILEHDYTLEEYEKDFFEGGIELNIDGLVIDGQNHILNGNNLSRIFIITGKNITLKNIIFKNGQSFENLENSKNSNGGAIRIISTSKLTIKKAKFINNNSEYDGGAIYNYLGILTLINCTLNNNTATNGGSINNWKGVVEIENTTLTNNTADHGGAIYNVGGILIDNTTLTNNTADHGGAVYNWGRIFILITIIEKNMAKSWGGAIYNYEGLTEIQNSTLNKNTSYEGGAIYNAYDGEITITNTTLTNNTATEYGGAIYNQENMDYIEIKKCKFEGNTPQNIYKESR